MAQALENNRPAYVKLAFPGTDTLGVFDVSDRLKFFKQYVLEGGKHYFEFEIINPDEKIEELLKEQASFFYDGVSKTKPVQAQSYVLMEWGYVGENDVPIKSKVHSGHVVSLKYAFSSSPEKSIRFIVTDTVNYYSSYTQGVLTAQTPLENLEGGVKKPSTIVSELIEGLLSRIPLVKGVVNFSGKTTMSLDSSQSWRPLTDNENYETLTPAKSVEFQNLEDFLNKIGISTGTENENDYSAGKTGTAITAAAGEAATDTPSVQQKGNDDPHPSRTTNVGSPMMSDSAGITLNASEVSNGIAGTVTDSYQNLLNQGSDIPNYAITLSADGFIHRTTTTEAGSSKLKTAIEGASNDALNASLAANDSLTKAHIQESAASESESLSEAKPPPRMAKLISPQGQPLIETITDFIRKLSDILASPAEDIKLGVLPEGSMFSRDVKIEDVLRIIKEDLKSTSPKNSTRTVVAVVNSFSSAWDSVASKYNVSNSLKDTEREDLIVRSFPQVQMSNPENIKLDYGGKDSIISSFQSDVELGYMLKNLVKPATPNIISDNYSFLFKKEALLSISNTLGEAAGEGDEHKASRRENLDQWINTNNSVTNVDRADFAYLESTLSLITNFKDFLEAEQLESILSEDETNSFLRLVERLQVVDAYRELLGIDDSIAAYFVSTNTQFDNVNGTSVMGRLLSTHMTNETETKHLAFKIKVQTLGIPELDEKFNIAEGVANRKRRVYFKAHDVSRERYSNQEELHWLTGQYQINQLSHTITPENGYITDMELVRSAY